MRPLINCLIPENRYQESGKEVLMTVNDKNEHVLFFKIDDCYIKTSKSKKCDLMVVYSDSKWRLLLLVELKGKKIEDAIKQFEETIKNDRFKHILDCNLCKSCKKDRCVKIFLVVHGGGITVNSDLKERVKKYGFFFETKPQKCDLKEIIRMYKNKYAKSKKRKRRGV
jgi:hypothetical protein